MNLHQLYYFRALARCQSFSKAADVLCVTQPTLSYAINSLEKELGLSLINRGNREEFLTENGKIFLEYVSSSIENLEHGLKVLNTRSEPISHSLRLVSDRVMPAISEINYFRNNVDCSNIEFSFIKSIGKDIEKQVLIDNFDIGFQAQEPKGSGLEYVMIPDAKIVMIVPRGHPFETCDSVDLRDVDWSQKVVARYMKIPSPRELKIVSLYKQVGYDVKNASSIAKTTLGITCLVEAGFGIAIIPYFDHLKDFDVSVLPISYPLSESHQYMIRRRNFKSFSAADKFFSAIRKRYGDPEIIKL